MKRFLAAQFVPVLRAWRNGYEAEVRRAAIAFFLLVFLAFGVCLAVPELRLGFSAYLQHLFQGMDLTDGAGNLSPLLLLAMVLRYDRLCREAIAKGAPVAKLFAVPSREKIGRAKSVPAEEYQQVYQQISAEMEQEITAIAEEGGEDA